MNRSSRFLISAFFVLSPLFSFAHEGHGHFHADRIWHYLTSPVHITPIAIAVAIAIVYLIRKSLTMQTNSEKAEN